MCFSPTSLPLLPPPPLSLPYSLPLSLYSPLSSSASQASPSSPPYEEQKLRDLINPVPPSWITSGYLMLRMKLPHQRYAWTYIVGVVWVYSGCGLGYGRLCVVMLQHIVGVVIVFLVEEYCCIGGNLLRVWFN